MGYVCNFLIRSLGILVEIIVLSDRKKTNNSVQMTKLQRLIKTYLHYVGDSDLITNKFLLIDTLVHTNVKKYIKRQENQTNSPALGYSHFFYLFHPVTIHSYFIHWIFIRTLLHLDFTNRAICDVLTNAQTLPNYRSFFSSVFFFSLVSLDVI